MKRRDVTGNNLMGLSPLEERILRMLDNELRGVADIARTISRSYQTTEYMLGKLHTQGWLKRIRRNKRTLWTREDKEFHVERLDNLMGRLFTKESTKNLRAYASEDAHLLEGKQALVDVYKNAYSERNRQQRLYGTETIETTELLATYLGQKKTESMNIRAIENKVLTSVLLPKSYYEHFGRELGLKWLKSFEGRASKTYLIEDEFLTGFSDISIFNNTVHLLNWEDELVLEIKNPALVSMLTHCFGFIQMAGRKIDQNQHIRELIEKMERKEAAQK